MSLDEGRLVGRSERFFALAGSEWSVVVKAGATKRKDLSPICLRWAGLHKHPCKNAEPSASDAF